MRLDAIPGADRQRLAHIGLAASSLAAGLVLWWFAPIAQTLLGLGWAGDFGQLCLVILAVSVIGRLAERLLA